MSRAEWKRMRRWLLRFLLAEAVVVAAFIGCCAWLPLRAVNAPELSPMPEPAPAPEPEVVVEVRYATEEEQAQHDRDTVEAIARTVWGEARGCSTTEQAAVVWCVLNRVDSPKFPDDPLEVVQQAGQFSGYHSGNPVYSDLLDLTEDVLARWELEKLGVGSVGRVLPADYLFFEGDCAHNQFRRDYIRSGETWDWSLASPYEG